MHNGKSIIPELHAHVNTQSVHPRVRGPSCPGCTDGSPVPGRGLPEAFAQSQPLGQIWMPASWSGRIPFSGEAPETAEQTRIAELDRALGRLTLKKEILEKAHPGLQWVIYRGGPRGQTGRASGTDPEGPRGQTEEGLGDRPSFNLVRPPRPAESLGDSPVRLRSAALGSPNGTFHSPPCVWATPGTASPSSRCRRSRRVTAGADGWAHQPQSARRGQTLTPNSMRNSV